VPVNSTHSDYEATIAAWLRARDVLAGDDAVKAGDCVCSRSNSFGVGNLEAKTRRTGQFGAQKGDGASRRLT